MVWWVCWWWLGRRRLCWCSRGRSPKPMVQQAILLVVRLRCRVMGILRSLARSGMIRFGGVRRSSHAQEVTGRSRRRSPNPVVKHSIILAFRLRCRVMGILRSLARTGIIRVGGVRRSSLTQRCRVFRRVCRVRVVRMRRVLCRGVLPRRMVVRRLRGIPSRRVLVARRVRGRLVFFPAR